VCPAGDICENQGFSKRLSAETEVIKTDGRGWGLRTNQALRKVGVAFYIFLMSYYLYVLVLFIIYNLLLFIDIIYLLL